MMLARCIALLFASLSFVSGQVRQNGEIVLEGFLRPAEIVPPLSDNPTLLPDFSGYCEVSWTDTSDTLSWECTHNVPNPTGVAIYTGGIATIGEQLFSFGTSPNPANAGDTVTVSGSMVLTLVQQGREWKQMFENPREGNCYVQINSDYSPDGVTYPYRDGALRGQMAEFIAPTALGSSNDAPNKPSLF